MRVAPTVAPVPRAVLVVVARARSWSTPRLWLSLVAVAVLVASDTQVVQREAPMVRAVPVQAARTPVVPVVVVERGMRREPAAPWQRVARRTLDVLAVAAVATAVAVRCGTVAVAVLVEASRPVLRPRSLRRAMAA